MQGKQPLKKKAGNNPALKKPYLKGPAFSGLAVRRGLRVLGYLLLAMLLYFFLGQLMVVDIAWLRVLINLVVLAGLCALMHGSGAREGEADVSFAEIALSRQQDHRSLSQGEKNKCFHPYKGFVTALSGALPLFLLCLVYAVLAVKEHYTLGSLPSWLSSYSQRQDMDLALAYYQNRPGIAGLDILRLLARLAVFPFVNLVGQRNADALLLVERLSPLLLLIAPLFYGLGYARGEAYRARVHGGIAANAKRAQRKKKKQQARRQEPRQLV